MQTNPSGGEFQRLSPGRFSFCFPFESEGLRFETRFAQLLFLLFFALRGLGNWAGVKRIGRGSLILT